MTKISTYVLDQDVVGGDKWIGSDIQNQNRTKNFTPDKLASYFNDNQIVNIGMPIQYKYYTLDPLEVRPIGTLTFETEIGSSVPFSTITTFLLSKYTTKQNDVSQYLDFLNQSKVLLYKSNDINQFGFYRILTLEPYITDPTFFELTVEFIDGNGSMLEDKDYMISLVSLQQDIIPTKTSDLINDGEDGIHPFITAQDVPDALIFTSPLVDTAGTITINQSGLSSDGYLSSTDWLIFNGKQDALLGTGFVKSTAGIISYDTNTYYLASNPDGFITSAALTGYVPYTGATQAVNLGAYNLTVNNISVGKGNGTGTFNTAIGNNSLLNNTTGSGNSALGANSLQNNLAGNSNTAIGHQALYSNQGGGGNTAIGATALFSNTTGIFNSAIGVGTLVGSTTGSRNVALGFESGRTIADKATLVTIINNSILLGYRTSPLADNETNQIVIGYDAIGAGSNTVVLGNSSIVTTVLRGNVGVNTTTPISRLHISGPQATIRIDDTNSMDTLNSFQMVCRDYDDIQQMRFGFSTPLGAGAKTIMTLDQTGNVGINTTIPEQELHVVGNARVTGAIYDSNNEPGVIGQVLSSTVTGTDWVDIVDTGLTSVGLTMPVAFSVANSPLTSNGTIDVTAVGTSAQYIRGDGQLASFPTSGGGGSSVTYYLNGSIPSSVAGYQQMDNDAVIGPGTDFSLTGNGLIAQFLTDDGNPNRIEIPGGSWNFEMFFNISSVGGNTKFYIDLLKYDGTTFTLISSGSTNPEEITGGTSVDLYLTSLAVPTTPLLVTDRLAIRVYIVDNSGGRTATLHTEDNNLCEIITTFSSGVASLNGLTASTQYFAVGTSGMDFNISSLVDTHTFNLPTASAVNRGALSSADWITFNSKFNLPSLTSGSVLFSNGTTIAQDNANFFWDDTNNRLGIGTASPSTTLHIKDVSGTSTIVNISTNTSELRVIADTIGKIGTWNNSDFTILTNRNEHVRVTPLGNVGIGTTNPVGKLTVSGSFASGSIMSVDTSSTTSFIRLLADISSQNLLNWQTGTDFRFATSNQDYSSFSEKMRITSAGNIGIGTTNPFGKLTSLGNSTVPAIFSLLDNSTNAILLQGGSNTSYGWKLVQDEVITGDFYIKRRLADVDTTVMTLKRDTGNVGIGTTSPATALDVNGVITATGGNSTSWNAKQDAITLTTTGTSGAATLVGSTLNIPQYSGGGGSGVHAQRIIKSGEYANLYLSYSSAPTTGSVIQNRLYMMPFFPNQTITTQSLSINVTTLFAGGLTKILIFSDVDGSPTTKLYESADFDCSTIGIKTATTTFTFTAGTTYWISIVSNNGTNQFTFLPQASVYAFTGAAGFNGFTHNYTSVTYSSIPSTIAFFTGQGGNIPMVAIRKA